mgnify:CR=1 FL=1
MVWHEGPGIDRKLASLRKASESPDKVIPIRLITENYLAV